MFGFAACPAVSAEVHSAGAFGPFLHENAGLSDAEIRVALAEVGLGPLAGLELLLEEVECSRGHVRADYIGLISNALAVIEIKSDRDTLRRFNEQIRIYSAVADRVTLVVGWSLAVHALRVAPWWWDVLLAEREPPFDIRFVPLRDGAQNPGVTANALVAMLPIDDVRRLACTADDSLARLRGQVLRQAVANRLSRDELRVAVGKWLARLSQQRNGTAS